MNAFDVLEQTRTNILDTIEHLSNEQLNFIPPGFNNNIIWNIGHNLITQELLLYKLSNLDCHVSEELINKYRKGTKPQQDASDAEIQQIKALLKSSPQQTKADFENGVFKTYQTYTTSYNVTLTSIEDAIYFNNIHEGLHFGYVMALMRCF